MLRKNQKKPFVQIPQPFDVNILPDKPMTGWKRFLSTMSSITPIIGILTILFLGWQNLLIIRQIDDAQTERSESKRPEILMNAPTCIVQYDSARDLVSYSERGSLYTIPVTITNAGKGSAVRFYSDIAITNFILPEKSIDGEFRQPP